MKRGSMAKNNFNQIYTLIIFGVLILLTYLLLKPLLMSVILGTMLAFIFLPIYNFIYKYTKRKDFSATLVCIILLAVIIVPLWYLTPVIIDQSIKFLSQVQQVDFREIFQNIFPSLSQTGSLSKEIIPSTGSFISKITNYILGSLSKFLTKIPTMFLQVIVMLFTFYFILRDNSSIKSYIRSLIPFSKKVQDKLFKSSKEITLSVIYGRIAMGIAQGLIVGIGFFVFGLKNALLLTALAALAGILPIIGTVIVWLPVSIFLFASGNNITAFGIIGFGLLATVFESIIQPILLAKMVKMNSSIMLIGMIGGLFMFGILGVIIGPLILAYLLIVLEIYRDKRVPGFFIEENKKENN
jgi:predicted PurR-regulated permease PerM